MAELKQQLIKLSESIVDISERLDELEFSEESSQKQELFAELKQIADKMLELKPLAGEDDEAYINFGLGSICSLLGYYEKAEQAYDEALSRWPDHVGILNEAFDVLVETGKMEKAKTFIERSIKHGGETPDILYNYASLTAHMGKIDEAKIILINALAKFPGDKGCRALLEELDIMLKENGRY
jgi:tetratricopeptide (TPR) repeat protein